MKATRVVMLALLVGIVAGTAYAQYGGYGHRPGDPNDNPGYNPYYDPQPYSGHDSGQAPDMDVGFFYQELSPYGEWVRHPQYGWVWFPRHVHAGWRPYSSGRWAESDYGWMWVSDEPFGWATYHYGRWAFDPYLGWLWVPGTDWGPAWVAWQYGQGYVGWAPLPPTVGWQTGVGLQLGGFSLSIGIEPRYYSFVEERRFLDTRLGGYILPEARNISIIHRTKNVTDYGVSGDRVVNRGVPVENIERVTGRTAQRFRVTTAASPGITSVKRDVITVFRPANSKLETVKVGQRNNAGLPQVAPSAERAEPKSPTAKPPEVAPVRKGTAPVPIPVAPRIRPAPQAENDRQFQREQKDLKANQDKERRALEQIHRKEMTQAQAKANAQEVAKTHAAEVKALEEQRQIAAQQLLAQQQVRRQAANANAASAHKVVKPAGQPTPQGENKATDQQKPKKKK